jgi:hypothetical protein
MTKRLFSVHTIHFPACEVNVNQKSTDELDGVSSAAREDGVPSTRCTVFINALKI